MGTPGPIKSLLLQHNAFPRHAGFFYVCEHGANPTEGCYRLPKPSGPPEPPSSPLHHGAHNWLQSDNTLSLSQAVMGYPRWWRSGTKNTVYIYSMYTLYVFLGGYVCTGDWHFYFHCLEMPKPSSGQGRPIISWTQLLTATTKIYPVRRNQPWWVAFFFGASDAPSKVGIWSSEE